MPLDVGSRLAHYEVIALIGEGGMGEVYQATDTKLNRQVALKILPEAFASDPDRLARFQREAQVLASLNHPGIAQIHGLEEQDGTKALVLELVEGPTLADRIAHGPIPVDAALPIAKQIAEALEAAHEAGVIHRDLKPANIKVRDDGTVKVLDFGLAKALDTTRQGDPPQSPTVTADATQMGVIMGTAAYMSPEQARGKPVDKRADIWAFGCVLYEMLTGKRAFEGEDVSVTLADVIRADLSWEALPNDLAPTLATYLRRCLEKDPHRRVRDIGDVRLAMDGAFGTAALSISDRSGMPVASAPATWRRVAPPLLATVVVSSLLTGVTVWTLRSPGPATIARFRIPLAAEQAFTATTRHVVAASPDGQHVVYVADGLYLRPIDQLEANLITGTSEGNGRSPFFSPDGQWIGFYAGGQLKKVSIRGGAPVTLGDAAQSPLGASWGADDMILFGQGPGGIWRVPGTAGTPEVLITVEPGESAHGPQMLPGETWVLFTLGRADDSFSWDEAQVVVQSLETGDQVVLIETGRDARYLPSGHLVYALNGVLFAMAFDPEAPRVIGGPVPLVDGIRQSPGSSGTAHFSVAGNGSLVYVPGAAGGENDFSLAWVTLAGEETLLAAPRRRYGDVRVSPDETRVATVIVNDENTDLWIWSLAQGSFTQLTFDEAQDDTPVWTPEGSRVVFRSSRDGGGLFWKAADGTGEVERLFESPDRPRPWGWTTDGRLVFSRDPGDVGVLSLEGDRTVRMVLQTDFTEEGVAVSPDGRWIAYQSNEFSLSDIFVRPFPNVDDGKWRVSTSLGFDPLWSPDGRSLFFETGEMMHVAVVETDPTFSHGAPMELFNMDAYPFEGTTRAYDLAADGQRFLVRKASAGSQTARDDNGLVFVENWTQELLERVPID